jgi:uncharacterized protein YecE (DUF72 family)
MRYWIGTSGYNYPEWRGSFYPPKLRQAEMLPFYAERFPTVEINYTFYRLPTEKLLAGWAQATPANFRFTLKAPRRITHDAKLRATEELTAAFCRAAQSLGDRLAALLFQLPPSFKKDVAALEGFLATLPPGARAAFEFRHDSWHDDAVFDALRRRNLALCIADSERMSTPLVATADYGYFRLRDEGYQPDDIRRWAGRIAEAGTGWSEAFIYFKHEEQGKGPELARLLIEALG